MIGRAPTATADAYLETLRLYLGARYSHHTVEAFLRQSRGFLVVAGAKPRYTRADLLGYLDGLVRRGYKARSIGTMLAGVRALFRALDQPWPLDRADLHLGLPVEESSGPVLPAVEVRALIARSPRLGFPDRQLLALAATWGFRNSELATILGAGLDGQHVTVQTAKTGRRRQHGVPPALRELLTFPAITLGTDGTHKRFDAIMRTLREPRTGEGWHAVRRSLATGLHGSGLNQYTVSRYMGWTVRETGFVYDRRSPEEIDAEVYPRHPFLALWGLPANSAAC